MLCVYKYMPRVTPLVLQQTGTLAAAFTRVSPHPSALDIPPCSFPLPSPYASYP